MAQMPPWLGSSGDISCVSPPSIGSLVASPPRRCGTTWCSHPWPRPRCGAWSPGRAKRSDVSDARDRHANVEVAYPLQKMEAYDGIAVLATNLRGNVDEAFTRRLSVIVEFPPPDVERRAAIWKASLGSKVPLGDDVDLVDIAERFDLRGGDIPPAPPRPPTWPPTTDRW